MKGGLSKSSYQRKERTKHHNAKHIELYPNALHIVEVFIGPLSKAGYVSDIMTHNVCVNSIQCSFALTLNLTNLSLPTHFNSVVYDKLFVGTIKLCPFKNT